MDVSHDRHYEKRLKLANGRDILARSDQNVAHLTSSSRQISEQSRDASEGEKGGLEFEEHMMQLRIHTCSICHSEKWTSDSCACRRQTFSYECSSEISINLGEIPEELQDLTMAEQLLIARVHPLLPVYIIDGGQSGYSAHKMNSARDTPSVAVNLPHDINAETFAIMMDERFSQAQKRVRADQIRRALLWLRGNNRYYGDIVIDESKMRALPEHVDVKGSLPVDISSQILTDCNERSVELISEPAMCMTFPTLFPYGRADWEALEQNPVRYFQLLISYPRFAKDLRFPFYAHNLLARRAAMRCADMLFLHQPKIRHMDIEEFRSSAQNPDSHIADLIKYYGATLRGSQTYWRRKSLELKEMILQIGTPTIFFTLTAADHHWPDLFRLLAPHLTEQQVSAMSEQERATLMHANPLITARFFAKRCDAFFNKCLLALFPSITDWWYRYEWQHRGSPHVHGFLWMSDAPNCDSIDSLGAAEKQQIVDYFDQIVSAVLPESKGTPDSSACRKRFRDLSQSEKAQDLINILKRAQIHKCGRCCRGRGQSKCRFQFPKPLETRSTIREVDGQWIFFPKRNHQLLNAFNAQVSQFWRGNTDFSPITSNTDQLRNYRVYASKTESRSKSRKEKFGKIFSEILERALDSNENDPTRPATTLVQQIFASLAAERDFSAQEVMHHLMGRSTCNSSRTFSRLVLSGNGSHWGLVDETQSVDIIDFYARRPQELEALTLYKFAKEYLLVAESYVKRRKDCILLVFPHLKTSTNPVAKEEFYEQQCRLHVPWRHDYRTLRKGYTTWEEAFCENFDETSLMLPSLLERYDNTQNIPRG